MTHHSKPRTPAPGPASLPSALRRSRQRCLVGLLLLGASAAGAAPLDDIRRQVEASQFEEAYRTGQANPQLLGDVHFDFLYGVAAISVGRVAEGLLALERHLSAVPANDRARLELARGYFLLGDYPRARSEFEFVLRYNPPAGVRATIADFLQAMQLRESADRRASARLYAEVGLGHDNNVNGGTFRDAYTVGVQSIVPDAASRQVADSLSQVAVGGQHQMRVSNRLTVFVGGDFDHRANFKQDAYNLTSAGVYVGFSQLSGPAQWRTTLSVNQLLVGGNRYRDSWQVGTEANLTFSQEQSLQAFGQFSWWRYAAPDRDRDARVTTLGAMFTQNMPAWWGNPSLGVRGTFNQEDNQRLRPDYSKKGPLLRVFASISPLQRLRLSAGVSASRQDYQGPDIFYQLQGDPRAVRRDDVVAADAVANYTIDALWSVRADASWTITRSNQDLYDSSRKTLNVKLRYQF